MIKASRSALLQGREQAAQVIVVDLVHESEQLAQGVLGETFAREPTQIV